MSIEVEDKQTSRRARSHDDLRDALEHAAHLLPAQGPITVFVHHNTLHAFEQQTFDGGVRAGAKTFGCHSYLPESRYRQLLDKGRIRIADLESVLLDDLGDDASALVACLGTRYSLRLAMLQQSLVVGTDAELEWALYESDALHKFRSDCPPHFCEQMLASTRRWVMRDLRNADRGVLQNESGLGDLVEQFDESSIESWSDSRWEAITVELLWRACMLGVDWAASCEDRRPASVMRHRDAIRELTDVDTDELVHEVMIRFCSVFLDQGFAHWQLPLRGSGFLPSFCQLYRDQFVEPTRWLQGLAKELQRVTDEQISPFDSINESLAALGVSREERDEFLTKSLLALPGWAGMVWQMETNADWAPHPAPADSLAGFLAVRLILERLAIQHVISEHLDYQGPLRGFRNFAEQQLRQRARGVLRPRAFHVFQLAQLRGWSPQQLLELSPPQWSRLMGEIDAFSSVERRRAYQLAFERKYRNEALDSVSIHAQRVRGGSTPDETAPAVVGPRPAYQVVCCIDDREESFRRHIEECDPECETFGVAGFFGVAMYYRGATEAHFRPLCPVNIKPRHFVVEEPVYSFEQSSRRRAEARRRIGHATHRTHLGTRTIAGGLLAGLLGSLAAFPLVARVLFPRITARILRTFGRIVQPPVTQLRLERMEAEPGSENGQLGYSVEEMARIVEGGLRAIGLGQGELFAPLVVICGHGSSSLNNPHEAAYDCGACGGGRGGPNARAFAQMANDARVRRLLSERGLPVPEDVIFVGGYHNTCDDSVTWYDLDRIAVTHRQVFERAKDALEQATVRNAHERCRRFESASLTLTPQEALRHVEGRAADLSQTRPELGHATNALCFVGRREWSRGLFLDRRAFLTSYDPRQDDEQSSILERLLQAVIPVCAGINLEYYFSYLDPYGYGCGTKLPHNVTSLLGVMDGAASDLRPGLPWQMVEIHEPLRLLFVIESTPAALQRIIAQNEAIARLVCGGWVQLALLDTATSQIKLFEDGDFQPYVLESNDLPITDSSYSWYRGWREHLGFASIKAAELAAQ